jgi:endonuclease YncB( thermonuclease family)
MTWYAIRLVLLGLLLLAGPALAEPAASVLDGDTIKLKGVTYRLLGIDAPEKSQVCQRDNTDWLCGQEAAAHLRGLVARQRVSCEERDRDRYGRIVAVCRAGGVDLNRAMVRAGLAWAYTQYSRDYEDAELEAQILGNGVWAPNVRAQPAWDWRRGRRSGGSSESRPNPGLTGLGR